MARRITVEALELRAREAAKAQRDRARAPGPVQVEHLSAASAVRANRFDIPLTWLLSSLNDVDVVLKVAPVLAQRDIPESGLVLASIPVLVTSREERSNIWGAPHGAAMQLAQPRTVVTTWGANSTMRSMRQEDWKFALSTPWDSPVPAYVGSHLRALAYYSALPVGQEVLRRWNAAQEKVIEQIELLESVFGQQDRERSDVVVDMSGEQVLRHRDRRLAAAWCTSARTIASSSKAAYARAADQWVRQQGEDDGDVDRADA